MAQEYKLIHFDPGKEPFFDRNGNQWINVLFEGYQSEPTKWVMRPESVAKHQVGELVYGRLEQVEGKNYQRFYKEQKPNYQGGGQASNPVGVNKPNYTPKDDDATRESINRSVALKAAVDICASTMQAGMNIKTDVVEAVANRFLAWLNNEKPKLDLHPDPMDRIFQGNEPYEGNPGDVPFD